MFSMKNKWLGSIYLTLAASIWGGMFVVVKIVVSVIPPIELVWLRYLVAGVVLFIWGIITKKKWRIDKRDWKWIFLIGLIGNTISIVTQEYGTLFSSAQTGAIVTSATPAFMLIFAKVLLKEKLTKRKVVSVVLATLGVFLIVGIDRVDLSHQLGGIFLFIAALTWALMSILIKLVPSKYSIYLITNYAIWVAGTLLTPFVIADFQQIAWNRLQEPIIGGGILYLGAVSTAGAFILWNKGIQMMDCATSGLFFFFQPLVGTFLGWLILHEPLTIWFWIGSLLIFASVLLITLKRK